MGKPWSCHLEAKHLPFFKVCGPCVVTLLNWTPIVEWYMAWLVLSISTKITGFTMRLHYVLIIL